MESKEAISIQQEASLLCDSSSWRWWSKDTVCVVTGANKGIGFAVVKRLAQLGLTVILTARDTVRGSQAVESLRARGMRDVHFSQLDVSDPDSITTFVSWFKSHFQALDVLVNNAAVSFNDVSENTVEHAETVIRTNFYGVKLLTESLLPLFRRSSSHSRILNISSRLGSINRVRNPKIKRILMDENLSEGQIEEVTSLFIEDAKNGTWQDQGWPEYWTEYAVSKLALNAYSRVLAKRYEKRGLSVNCFCPGYTQTAMTRGKGTHTAEDAANIAVRLALAPPQRLQTGKFYLGCNSVVNSKL